MKNISIKQIDNLYKKAGAKKDCTVSKSLNVGTLQNSLAYSFNCKGCSRNPSVK